MKIIRKILKWLFIAWGALSLIAAVCLAGLIVYGIYNNRTKIDQASPPDVRYVLNGCELGESRIEQVVNSYVSSRSFCGDHLDAYAIRISGVTEEELTASTDEFRGRWYRGDQLPKVLDDAVSFVGGWLHEIPWFPSEAELRSGEIYIYSLSIYCHGVRPTAVELIFVRPKDRMVFFFSGKI